MTMMTMMTLVSLEYCIIDSVCFSGTHVRNFQEGPKKRCHIETHLSRSLFLQLFGFLRSVVGSLFGIYGT